MIKLIIFDCDGVLVNDFDEKKYNYHIKKFFKKHGLPLSLIKKQNEIWNNVKHKALKGKLTQRQANEMWIKELGLPVKLVKEFMDLDMNYWGKTVRANPQVKETLKKLKKNGYKLAVLSNEVRQSHLKKKILSFVGLDGYLDAVYASHSIGYVKPEKQAYLHIVKRFKTKPKYSMFVGHGDQEIGGAKRAGLKVVCFRKKKHPLADFHIKKFSEILRILKKD